MRFLLLYILLLRLHRCCWYSVVGVVGVSPPRILLLSERRFPLAPLQATFRSRRAFAREKRHDRAVERGVFSGSRARGSTCALLKRVTCGRCRESLSVRHRRCCDLTPMKKWVMSPLLWMLKRVLVGWRFHGSALRICGGFAHGDAGRLRER